MKTLLCAVLFCFFMPVAAASFNYHGTLRDGNKPADGKYDLELTLYSAATGGKIVGGPLILYSVPVHNGSFNTEADFGPLADAKAAWLGVSVRSAGSEDFSVLGARAAVTAASTASVCPGAWTLAGNAGNPAGSYLGTADGNPLVFEVNGSQAGTLIPTSDVNFTNAPNVVFGSSGNNVGTTVGATIAGGGSVAALCGTSGTGSCVNAATALFSTVGGGAHNNATSAESTIGGGSSNTTGGDHATIAGGYFNTASGNYSVVSGYQNTAGGSSATISGGYNNVASADNSTIGGGTGNTASGSYATVSGGIGNTAAAPNSFAAGTYANVPSGDTGSFVWSDATGNSTAPFSATAANQFLISATGGIGIGTANLGTDGVTQAALTIQGFNTQRGTVMFCSPKGPNCSHVHYGTTGDWFIRSAQSTGTVALQDAGGTVLVGNTSSPATATILNVGGNAAKPGGGAWAVLSDARLKQNISDIADPLGRVLELHGVEFDYIPGSHALEAPGRQIGFIAQDVEKVFPDWVGTGNDGYKFVAVHGFEALTVEAMRQLREEKDAQIKMLQDKLDQLNARVERLEASKGE